MKRLITWKAYSKCSVNGVGVLWTLNSLCEEFSTRPVFGEPLLNALRYSIVEVIRPLQREVIEAVLNGHDVFLQAATSFGKSLCFQLPAVVDLGCKQFLHSSNNTSR